MKSKIALNTRLASLDFEPFSGGFFSIFPSFYFSLDIFLFLSEPSMQRQRYNFEHRVGTLYMVIRVFTQEDTFFTQNRRTSHALLISFLIFLSNGEGECNRKRGERICPSEREFKTKSR